MTATHLADDAIQLTTVRVRHVKLAVSLAVVTVLLALLFALVPRDGQSTFRLGDPASNIDLGSVAVPTAATSWGVLVLLVLLTAWSVWDAVRYHRTPLWLPVAFGALAVFAFLTWAAADGLVPVTGLLFGALSLSVPLIFGALGGVIGERVGVVNVAIEGSSSSERSAPRWWHPSPGTPSWGSSRRWWAASWWPSCSRPSRSDTWSTRSSSVSCSTCS